MREAVICEPLRTPVGRYGGVFRGISAASLGVTVLRELMARTRLAADTVEHVILGHCSPTADAPAIGRVVALDAGLPVTVPGVQIDRRCGSRLQAVIYAAMQVRTSAADLLVAGGVESMSSASFYTTGVRWGLRGDDAGLRDSLARARVTAGGLRFPVFGGMLETAENMRRQYRIARSEQDEYSLRSHERAIAAQRNEVFDEEIVPVALPAKDANLIVYSDEHPRADASIESLSQLRPVLAGVDPEATVTAGNSSGQNDGAALCIVTHPEYAAALGLKPLVRLVSWAVAAVDPRTMGIGPVPATQRALGLAGLSLSDMDLIELNEAFAVQVLAAGREWALADTDWSRVNVNGSGISLGHPLGATGARILATLARELHRRGARYGLETMCIGGGQGPSAVFERVG